MFRFRPQHQPLAHTRPRKVWHQNRDLFRQPGANHIDDEDRRPGRFMLTGSANILMLPKIAEPLVGRMEILTLRPYSQGEMEGRNETFIRKLFSRKGRLIRGGSHSGIPLAQRIHRGGYPEAIRRSAKRRRPWFSSSLTMILQRDIRDLSNRPYGNALAACLAGIAICYPF
jgi:predicted AAA+ superfamily ATPase